MNQWNKVECPECGHIFNQVPQNGTNYPYLCPKGTCKTRFSIAASIPSESHVEESEDATVSPDNIDSKMASLVRRLREAENMSRVDLSGAANVTYGAVQSVENNEFISLTSLARIAHALGTNLPKLIELAHCDPTSESLKADLDECLEESEKSETPASDDPLAELIIVRDVGYLTGDTLTDILKGLLDRTDLIGGQLEKLSFDSCTIQNAAKLEKRIEEIERFQRDSGIEEETRPVPDAEVVEEKEPFMWEELARELASAVELFHKSFPHASSRDAKKDMLNKANAILLEACETEKPHTFRVLCSIEETDADGECVRCHVEAHELSRWKNLPAALRYMTSATFESSRNRNNA